MFPQDCEIPKELKLGPASEKDLKITGLLANLESVVITDKANCISKLDGFSCRSIRMGSYKTYIYVKVMSYLLKKLFIECSMFD